MKVQVFRRVDGKWDWRAVAGNGRIVATSGGQGYRKPFEAWRSWDAFSSHVDVGSAFRYERETVA
jgi:hypothetical protein